MLGATIGGLIGAGGNYLQAKNQNKAAQKHSMHNKWLDLIC